MKLAKKIAIYGFLAGLVVPTIFAVPASAGCSKLIVGGARQCLPPRIFAVPASAGCSKLIVGGARLCINLPFKSWPRNLVANKPPATLAKRALSGEPAELTPNHRPMAGLHYFIGHKSSR